MTDTDFAAVRAMPHQFTVCTEHATFSEWLTLDAAITDADTLHADDPTTEYSVVDNWHPAGWAVVVYTTRTDVFDTNRVFLSDVGI